MKVPLSWLKKYVPVELPARELAHKFTMAGVEVARVEQVGADWDPDKLLVGRVLKVDPHPNADRLSLPTVDLGNGETATVVCGAPNLAAGQKIAFAREGALLYSERSGKVEPLKKTKIRGVASAGMVCSELELGLGDDHDGILVLDGNAGVGAPLADLLGDTILELELTPNRVDCLSILGVAREAAALTGTTVTEPEAGYPEHGGPIEDRVAIRIDDPELCARYTASLIGGVTIGPSPQWLQDALTSAGQRPINNVVDVTNYVMLEYGQPLHAFDYDKVKDREVVVRPARPGETLVTLDGVSRRLDPPMLVIADSTDAVGLAGVMGGANTEVAAGTKSVFLESASFDPVNTRRTSARLRLHTEASHRFERGLRAELAPRALRRATRLILQVAGGTAAEGIVDLHPGYREPQAVKISAGRTRQLLGMSISTAEVERILTSLGFQRSKEPESMIDLIEAVEAAPAPERETTIWVIPPYWRSDIAIEDDVVEEVARITGYDRIPTTMLSSPIPHHRRQPAQEARERVRDALAHAGMQEIVSYPLTSLETLNCVDGWTPGLEPLRMSNPMSQDRAYLRTSLRGSLLEALEFNRRTNRNQGIRLFEIGRVYLRNPSDAGDLPHEKEMLVGVLSGPRFPVSWVAGSGDMGFFDAKGVLESVFDAVRTDLSCEPTEDRNLVPGRAARLSSGGRALGVLGEVAGEALDHFELEGSAVVMFEIDLEALAQVVPDTAAEFAATSKFPESERDLALLVDDGVPSAGIQRIIDRNGLVVRSTPFDVFSGGGVPAGKKSVAYRVVFRSSKSTLTSEQVDKVQEGILRQLRREVGAELRG